MRQLYFLKKSHHIRLQQKKPISGSSQAITLCVHPEFKVKDNPNNSKCVDGWRYIPSDLLKIVICNFILLQNILLGQILFFLTK